MVRAVLGLAHAVSHLTVTGELALFSATLVNSETEELGQTEAPGKAVSDQGLLWKLTPLELTEVWVSPKSPQLIPKFRPTRVFWLPPSPPPGPVDLVYNYFWLPLLLVWQRSSGPFTHSIFIYSAPGQSRKWQAGGGRQRCFHRI